MTAPTRKRLPATFMRGGTSKAVMFRREDLPADRAEWDAIFIAVMGSPDPNGRQLDGMGGGLSSLSKICVVGPSEREDADVDYTFVQVGVKDDIVDYSGNCGNMSAAIGPFSLDQGMIPAPQGTEAAVRIFNTNTAKLIVARFPVEGGLLAPAGDMAIDGVAGTAAPIRLEFMNPGGARTGRLLPTGRAVDVFAVDGLGEVEVSCIDAANPCVFVRAEALGKTGDEAPDALDRDEAFLTHMEAIRCMASVAMGIAPDLAQAARITGVPKVAMIRGPWSGRTLSGRELTPGDADLWVRMISVGQPHRAVPITGAVCLAVAAKVPGSLVAAHAPAQGPLRIAHASGVTVVDAVVETGSDGTAEARLGAVYRTARLLFSGQVHYVTH